MGPDNAMHSSPPPEVLLTALVKAGLVSLDGHDKHAPGLSSLDAYVHTHTHGADAITHGPSFPIPTSPYSFRPGDIAIIARSAALGLTGYYTKALIVDGDDLYVIIATEQTREIFGPDAAIDPRDNVRNSVGNVHIESRYPNWKDWARAYDLVVYSSEGGNVLTQVVGPRATAQRR